MRFRYLFCIAFILAPSFAFAEPPSADSKEFEPLANQLIDALQREDIVAFSQCWISIPQMEKLVSTITDPKIQKDRDKLKPYFEERNRQIAFGYGVLIEELKKQGKLADLKFVAVEVPGIREEFGVRKISSIKIAIKLGVRDFKIAIDDGFEYQKLWYFSDKPMYLEDVPSMSQIRLQQPNQKKEDS